MLPAKRVATSLSNDLAIQVPVSVRLPSLPANDLDLAMRFELLDDPLNDTEAEIRLRRNCLKVDGPGGPSTEIGRKHIHDTKQHQLVATVRVPSAPNVINRFEAHEAAPQYNGD